MEYKRVNDDDGNVNNDVIKLTDDNGHIYFIPNDSTNIEWIAYQEWLDLGNEPEPAD